MADIYAAVRLYALERMVRASAVVGTISERIPALSLPDWQFGAGAIAHTMWNNSTDAPRAMGSRTTTSSTSTAMT
jgi:hypothetical protein